MLFNNTCNYESVFGIGASLLDLWVSVYRGFDFFAVGLRGILSVWYIGRVVVVRVLGAFNIVGIELIAWEWASLTWRTRQVLHSCEVPAGSLDHSDCGACLDHVSIFGPNEDFVAAPSTSEVQAKCSGKIHLCPALLRR